MQYCNIVYRTYIFLYNERKLYDNRFVEQSVMMFSIGILNVVLCKSV